MFQWRNSADLLPHTVGSLEENHAVPLATAGLLGRMHSRWVDVDCFPCFQVHASLRSWRTTPLSLDDGQHRRATYDRRLWSTPMSRQRGAVAQILLLKWNQWILQSVDCWLSIVSQCFFKLAVGLAMRVPLDLTGHSSRLWHHQDWVCAGSLWPWISKSSWAHLRTRFEYQTRAYILFCFCSSSRHCAFRPKPVVNKMP